MVYRTFKFVIAGLAAVLFLLSCAASTRNEKGVEAGMQHYDRLILKLDADSIAWLFTPNGNLGDIAIGRDSIKTFLGSFKNVRVLTQISNTTSLQLTRDSALQKGTYSQSDVVNEKDTVYVKGTYTAHWLWMKKQGWHILKMTTEPLK